MGDYLNDRLGLKANSYDRPENDARMYETNVWTMAWTKETKDFKVPFEQQINGLMDVLEPLSNPISEITNIPGTKAELVLQFSSRKGLGAAQFSPQLLERLTRLSLSLTIDLYPTELPDMMWHPAGLGASIEDFVRTGGLGKLKLGVERSRVSRWLGIPPNWLSDTKNYRKSALWKYGPLCVYFNEDKVNGIQIDDYDKPVWPYRGLLERCITVSRMENQLIRSKIPFRTEPFPVLDNGIRIYAESGVTLSFWADEDEEFTEPYLCEMSIWDRSQKSGD